MGALAGLAWARMNVGWQMETDLQGILDCAGLTYALLWQTRRLNPWLTKQEYIRMSSSCSGNSRSSLTSSHTALNIFAKLSIIFYGIHWNKKQKLKQKFVYQLCMLQFSIFNQVERWEKLNFPVDFQNISSAWGALLKKEKKMQLQYPFSVPMPCFYKFVFLKLRQPSW